ncbi:MAG: C25 family cysteine peptidase [Phycisphaerales bacterium]
MERTPLRFILTPVVALLALLAFPATTFAAAPGDARDDGDDGHGAAIVSPERLYLVIHARGLEDAAQEWADYRATRGWNAEAIAATDAAGLLPPHWNDAQLMREGLRQYFRDRFGQAQLRGVTGADFAVLLLGDVEAPDGSLAIATWPKPNLIASLRSGDPMDERIVGDHDYQRLDDDDDRPDFLLGRVPARSNAEAIALLERIRRYENDTPRGPWRRRMNFIASEPGFGFVDGAIERAVELVLDTYTPAEFDLSMTYASSRSPYCPPPARLAAITAERFTEGALLVAYVGHGHARMLDRLIWNRRAFEIFDFDAFDANTVDGARFPILFLLACSTGAFDDPEGAPSLAERLLFHDAGPVAIIAGSRPTHPYANGLYLKDLLDHLATERRPTIGAVYLAATRGLVDLDDDDRLMEFLSGPILRANGEFATPATIRAAHLRLYNLLGDPALEIAYPAERLDDLRVESGRLIGHAPNFTEGRATISIETARRDMPRASEMDPAFGRDDPELERKAALNYPLANDKVLRQTVVPVVNGRFEVALTAGDGLGDLDATPRWIKVYLTGSDGDAFGAIPWPAGLDTP